MEYDREKTTFLEAKGYRVLHFWNNDVMNALDNVVRVRVKINLPHFYQKMGEGGCKDAVVGGGLPKWHIIKFPQI